MPLTHTMSVHASLISCPYNYGQFKRGEDRSAVEVGEKEGNLSHCAMEMRQDGVAKGRGEERRGERERRAREERRTREIERERVGEWDIVSWQRTKPTEISMEGRENKSIEGERTRGAEALFLGNFKEKRTV